MTIPYESSTSGEKALIEIQRTLEKLGCASFGIMQDVEQGITIVQFKYQGRSISLHASWKGYADALFKRGAKKWAYDKEKREIQAKISVCSVLRDWIKGQIMAIECGFMTPEEVFAPHILMPDGKRAIDKALPLLLEQAKK